MADRIDLTCHACGYQDFTDGRDGFFYCDRCGSQADDIRETAVNDDDLFGDTEEGGGGIYSLKHRRQRPASVPTPVKVEPISQSQFWESLQAPAGGFVKTEEGLTGDGKGPTGPTDFAKTEEVLAVSVEKIRIRYVMGIQIMIQLQCEALIDKFKNSDVILGLAWTIWWRFLDSTGVFDDDWVDEEGQQDDDKREIMIWYRSLSKQIPLSQSLAITFLACHVAREPVLSTDILKWVLEGKLPYVAAFLEIEKKIGPPSGACPLSSSLLFRPECISLRKLESQAASISHTIGLDLPPVDFYAIALRYLKELSLPVEKILPSICRIYEWTLPPELWLSSNELRLPTRVGVMSMVIVAIRMLYNIHGFGIWEKSLSTYDGSSNGSGDDEPTSDVDVMDGSSPGFAKTSSHVERSELGALELLQSLEARYNKLQGTYDHSKDLSTYLHYCKDVVFAGLGPSFEDVAEEKIIDELWDYYEKHKDSVPSGNQEVRSVGDFHQQKKSRDEVASLNNDSKERRNKRSMHDQGAEAAKSDGRDGESTSVDESCSTTSDIDSSIPASDATSDSASYKEKVIRQMKKNMEENRFCYIPPRVNIKRLDYLHYVRKKDGGAYTYAAHADYYILLRACARIAQVDIRVMHIGVLTFERRLGWFEKRIGHCLNMEPPKMEVVTFAGMNC